MINHTDSRDWRDSDDSQKAALGPAKANAMTASSASHRSSALDNASQPVNSTDPRRPITYDSMTYTVFEADAVYSLRERERTSAGEEAAPAQACATPPT